MLRSRVDGFEFDGIDCSFIIVFFAERGREYWDASSALDLCAVMLMTFD
jgi:hypothetical protein